MELERGGLESIHLIGKILSVARQAEAILVNYMCLLLSSSGSKIVGQVEFVACKC